MRCSTSGPRSDAARAGPVQRSSPAARPWTRLACSFSVLVSVLPSAAVFLHQSSNLIEDVRGHDGAADLRVIRLGCCPPFIFQGFRNRVDLQSSLLHRFDRLFSLDLTLA